MLKIVTLQSGAKDASGNAGLQSGEQMKARPHLHPRFSAGGGNFIIALSNGLKPVVSARRERKLSDSKSGERLN